jgi:translocation and assembly module TamB
MTESTPTAKKPRRWPRRLALAFVLSLALVWFTPTIVAKTGLLNSFIAQATAKIDGKVGIGGISLGWFSPITLTDVQLTDAEGKSILAAPTVRSTHSLLSLARNPSDLGTFTIENPRLDIICTKDSTNLESALAKLLNDPTPSSGPRPLLVVAVMNGVVTVADGSDTWKIEGLDATVTVPRAGEPIRVQATGRSDGAPLDADLTLGSELVAKVRADGFPLAMAAPIARRFEPGFHAKGTLTVDLKATVSAGESAKTAGTIVVADLEVGADRFGAERLALKSVKLPIAIASSGGVFTIEKADLACDIGTASLTGAFDPSESPEKLLDRAGLAASVELDVARLAAMFPKLLRLRAGTALAEGRIVAKLASTAGTAGTTWTGSLGTTALRGTRNGQPIAWDQPLAVSFAGRIGADRKPAFDRLDAKAEFATIAASGTAERFQIAADVSLDGLAKRLGEFVELPGQFAGTAKLTANGTTSNGTTKLSLAANVANLVVADGARRFQEPSLVVNGSAEGAFFGPDVKPLAAANVTVTAGTESAEVKLLEPIADLRSPASGKVVAKLAGDLERWASRASSFVTIPKSIKAIGGQGVLGGTVTFTPAVVNLDAITADLKNARFHGYGLVLDEPQLLLDPTTGRIDRASGLIEFPTMLLRTSTVAASVKPFKLVPQSGGDYGVELDGIANANLARVQQMIQMQSDPKLGDRLDGIVAAGTVKVRTAGSTYSFEANLPIQKFVLGPPTAPTWTEEKLAIVAMGSFDVASDRLQLDRASVERPDGLKVDATGRIDAITTTTDLDLAGQLRYDLATLEPQLKKFLGKSFEAKGQGTREFKLAGRLQPDTFGSLNGNASLAWQSLKAYGFDVGQSQLVAKLDRGTLAVDPLEATFGQTGKVRLEPTVRFLPAGGELFFAKGKVIDQAKLTPVACADAIGYVLPAFAKSTETSGTISFDLDSSRLPLGDPEKGTMTGRLTLHEVQVGPGPVIAEVMQLAGAKSSTFSLNRDGKPQVVNVKLENGWVHHDNLTLATKSFTMVTSGRVSLNGDLEMMADVPLPDSDLGPLLKNNPKIREAMAKKRIQLPVRGTIHKPKLDPGAFRAAVRKVTDEIVRDLGKNALGGLLDKIGPPPKK